MKALAILCFSLQCVIIYYLAAASAATSENGTTSSTSTSETSTNSETTTTATTATTTVTSTSTSGGTSSVGLFDPVCYQTPDSAVDWYGVVSGLASLMPIFRISFAAGASKVLPILGAVKRVWNTKADYYEKVNECDKKQTNHAIDELVESLIQQALGDIGMVVGDLRDVLKECSGCSTPTYYPYSYCPCGDIKHLKETLDLAGTYFERILDSRRDIGQYFSPSFGTVLEKRPETLLHIYLSALSVEVTSVIAIMHYAYIEVFSWFALSYGQCAYDCMILFEGMVEEGKCGCVDLSGVIRIAKKYSNHLDNIQNAQFGNQDEQNDILLILKQSKFYTDWEDKMVNQTIISECALSFDGLDQYCSGIRLCLATDEYRNLEKSCSEECLPSELDKCFDWERCVDECDSYEEEYKDYARKTKENAVKQIQETGSMIETAKELVDYVISGLELLENTYD